MGSLIYFLAITALILTINVILFIVTGIIKNRNH
jgi:hypothetical protein